MSSWASRLERWEWIDEARVSSRPKPIISGSGSARSVGMFRSLPEQSKLVATAAKLELQRLKIAIQNIDRNAVGTHEIVLPYGNIDVVIRKPKFFEKVGRALKNKN